MQRGIKLKSFVAGFEVFVEQETSIQHHCVSIMETLKYGLQWSTDDEARNDGSWERFRLQYRDNYDGY
jgi:hypothetical protein